MIFHNDKDGYSLDTNLGFILIMVEVGNLDTKLMLPHDFMSACFSFFFSITQKVCASMY
jgi:hypothetical protein